LVPGKRKSKREEDLYTWLLEHCGWTEQQKFDLAPILDGFTAWEAKKYGIVPARQSVLQALVGNGFRIAEPLVIGLFIREKDAVPVVEPQHNEGIRVSSPSPELIEANSGRIDPQPQLIERDDSDREAYRKMQFNAELAELLNRKDQRQ